MRIDLPVFLLTRSFRDVGDQLLLTFWGTSPSGPVRVRVNGEEPLFYVPPEVPTLAGRREPSGLTDLGGRPVDVVRFPTRRAMQAERQRLSDELLPALESDVKPHDRFLMERFVTGAMHVRGEADTRGGYLDVVDPEVTAADLRPSLRAVSFDIETDGADGALFSIAVASREEEHVFVVGEAPARPGTTGHSDERAVIEAFAAWVRERDPDLLLGWNVVEFDLDVLIRKAAAAGIKLRLGRGGGPAEVLEPAAPGQPYVARVPGRVVLDGIATLRSATWSFESFSLENVARTLLGRGKKITKIDGEAKVEEIRRMYREDRAALCEYNLEDCRLVLDVFEAADLIGFAVERQRLTGLPMDRQGGSVAAFDHLYLPRLHRHGHVAPDIGATVHEETSPGGAVLDSAPGLYDNVLVLDFRSLYPSLIRTFRIDPMGMAFPGDDPVPGFEGAAFARDRHVLPGLIETLWQARDEARKKGDEALSRAIKILMNSFYGVLGTPGCRFFDPRLATSITRRGHEVLQRSRARIEERGHRVIYGDTDSLFVLIGAGRSAEECGRIGADLARDLNAWWAGRVLDEHRLECALEVRFETHYLRFLMPTLRDSEVGTKKRYAGTVRTRDGGIDVVFRGLEAVRTDWTPLARSFQRELYRRIFTGEPFEAYIRSVSDDLFAGLLDDQLVYRKRIRRDLEEYTKNAPPHVQAARKLDRTVRFIEYLMTTRGPEPVEIRTAPIDYQHYLERQLAPAADGILSFLGRDFMSLGSRQLSLF